MTHEQPPLEQNCTLLMPSQERQWPGQKRETSPSRRMWNDSSAPLNNLFQPLRGDWTCTAMLNRKTPYASRCSSTAGMDGHKETPLVRTYLHSGRSEERLTECKQLLMHGQRIVIPRSLQRETLKKIHEGHQGIERCRARAT